MHEWFGFRVVVNPVVAPYTYLVNQREGVIAFHDRHSMMHAMFWIAMLPRLRDIALEAQAAWSQARSGTRAGAQDSGHQNDIADAQGPLREA